MYQFIYVLRQSTTVTEGPRKLFFKELQYQISWKSDKRFNHWYYITDRQTDGRVLHTIRSSFLIRNERLTMFCIYIIVCTRPHFTTMQIWHIFTNTVRNWDLRICSPLSPELLRSQSWVPDCTSVFNFKNRHNSSNLKSTHTIYCAQFHHRFNLLLYDDNRR